MSKESWDIRYLRLAEHIACWSKDPSTKTGAVIVDPRRRLVSVGYNGLPQGIEDTPERLTNRDVKLATTIHCERNAEIFAQRDLYGCTLYTWPFMSCSVCAAMMIQAGITRVVAPRSDNPRWIDSFKLSTELFEEAGVEIVLYDDLGPDVIPTTNYSLVRNWFSRFIFGNRPRSPIPV